METLNYDVKYIFETSGLGSYMNVSDFTFPIANQNEDINRHQNTTKVIYPMLTPFSRATQKHPLGHPAGQPPGPLPRAPHAIPKCYSPFPKLTYMSNIKENSAELWTNLRFCNHASISYLCYLLW